MPQRLLKHWVDWVELTVSSGGFNTDSAAAACIGSLNARAGFQVIITVAVAFILFKMNLQSYSALTHMD